MADLNPLIRVRKHTVEQRQKALAELYRQAEELAAQKKDLEDQMAAEREKLKKINTVEMLTYYSNYTKAVKKRVADIEGAMKNLDGRIEVARETMREAFAEFKKVDIVQDRREAEERAALDKKESQAMDEMAVENFRRKTAETE